MSNEQLNLDEQAALVRLSMSNENAQQPDKIYSYNSIKEAVTDQELRNVLDSHHKEATMSGRFTYKDPYIQANKYAEQLFEATTKRFFATEESFEQAKKANSNVIKNTAALIRNGDISLDNQETKAVVSKNISLKRTLIQNQDKIKQLSNENKQLNFKLLNTTAYLNKTHSKEQISEVLRGKDLEKKQEVKTEKPKSKAMGM